MTGRVSVLCRDVGGGRLSLLTIPTDSILTSEERNLCRRSRRPAVVVQHFLCVCNNLSFSAELVPAASFCCTSILSKTHFVVLCPHILHCRTCLSTHARTHDTMLHSQQVFFLFCFRFLSMIPMTVCCESYWQTHQFLSRYAVLLRFFFLFNFGVSWVLSWRIPR